MQTLRQKRAKFALEKIRATRLRCEQLSNSSKAQKEFNAHASALPYMVHANGLGSAVAFYRSKGGLHRWLYDILSEWLTSEDQPYAASSDLLEAITTHEMDVYFVAQAEAMALSDWIKKLGRSYLASDTRDEDEAGTDLGQAGASA